MDNQLAIYNPLLHPLLTNYGGLDNYSILTYRYADVENNGMMNNYGWFSYSDSTFSTSATHTLNNFGSFGSDGNLLNSGILNNDGYLNSTVSLDNNGTLTNNGALSIGHGNFSNGGMFNNNGVWSNYDGTIIGNNGTVINTDRLQNYGALQNSGALTNDDTVNGSGTYTQSVGHTINNGSFSQGAIQINGGGVSGTGSFTGDVTIGSDASVNPGNSPGTLTFNGAFHSSGDFVFEIAGTAAGQYDVLAINGAADFTGGNVEFDFIDGFHASVGDHWDFLLANNVTGWDSLSFSSNVSGLGTSITQDSLGAHLSITSVPEPETYAMFMAGLGLMGFIARRRKNNQA